MVPKTIFPGCGCTDISDAIILIHILNLNIKDRISIIDASEFYKMIIKIK